MKRLWKRILAAMLVAALCLAPAAQALTTDQLKDLLGKYYINDIPQAALDAETIEEVIQALGDPYTMYLTPEEYAAFQASMSDQEVVGIGISAVACDDGLSIVGVYDGAPAQKLGLVGGDTIISVEGKSASLDHVVVKLVDRLRRVGSQRGQNPIALLLLPNPHPSRNHSLRITHNLLLASTCCTLYTIA